jgi:hypothetical protein
MRTESEPPQPQQQEDRGVAVSWEQDKARYGVCCCLACGLLMNAGCACLYLFMVAAVVYGKFFYEGGVFNDTLFESVLTAPALGALVC